jgi:energy-coupling factor transporter ATP-binding protein EcfA2
LASRDRTLDANTVVPVSDELSLLTTAAIYGANASGKSNLGEAMKAMKALVINSSKATQVGETIPVAPYALDEACRAEPSTFEVSLLLDGVLYRYGFAVDAARVAREWLYFTPKGKDKALFTREGQAFTLAPAFAAGDGLTVKVRPNALLLSVAAQFNVPLAMNLAEWFGRLSVLSGLHDASHRGVLDLCRISADFTGKVEAFVRALDVGIEALRIEGNRIQTLHRAFTAAGEPAESVAFDLETQESEGTKKMIALAGVIMLKLQSGVPLVIDEFDARLHPLLTREIVRVFNSPATNPLHAQLIVMTHDTNLLDRTLLRRDAIWFVEKDRFGASHLYSLANSTMKVRNDASFEQDYIKGKYGAIPLLGGLPGLTEREAK